MIKKIIIRSIIFVFVCVLNSCAFGNLNKIMDTNVSAVSEIKIIFTPTRELREQPLNIIIESEGNKKILLDIINSSIASNKLIKTAIYEGTYKIVILSNNGTKNIFDVDSYPNLYWEDKDKGFVNRELINFLRELLFKTLIENNIKLEKCVCDKQGAEINN